MLILFVCSRYSVAKAVGNHAPDHGEEKQIVGDEPLPGG
jgi:hypothetical protein